MKKGLYLVFLALLCACLPLDRSSPGQTATQSPLPRSSVTPTLAPIRTNTTVPPTSTETVTPTEIPTPTTVAFKICCPLEEETFASLRLILANPLKIPPIGKDEGHHGIDFAYFQRGERESIQGVEIYAILSGKTVLTLEDDIPYGYAILVETPLSDLPEPLQETLLATYLDIPQDLTYQGQCPEVHPPRVTGDMSVYHLYAHMEIQPSFQPGDPINCGSRLGTVGNTGYSSNPHLHLETRLGPSGADFRTMAFYQPTYSEEQRSTYCLWRMSGYYQLFDPFLILDAGG